MILACPVNSLILSFTHSHTPPKTCLLLRASLSELPVTGLGLGEMADAGLAEVIVLDVEHGALPDLVGHLEVGGVGQADADRAHRGCHRSYAPCLHVFAQKGEVRGSHGVSGAKRVLVNLPIPPFTGQPPEVSDSMQSLWDGTINRGPP